MGLASQSSVFPPVLPRPCKSTGDLTSVAADPFHARPAVKRGLVSFGVEGVGGNIIAMASTLVAMASTL